MTTVERKRYLPTKIVLVIDQEPTEMMIDYYVGVIDEQPYCVKRVDPAYFKG